MLDLLVQQVAMWSRATFPGQTRDTIIEHLTEELVELAGCPPEKIRIEVADMFILLIALCEVEGIDLEDATFYKHRVNVSRQWKLDDTIGYHKHT